jgi:hypothetical protein
MDAFKHIDDAEERKRARPAAVFDQVPWVFGND